MRSAVTDAGGSGDRPALALLRLLQRHRRPRFIIARTALGVGLIAYLWVSGAIDWSRVLGLAEAWHLAAGALLLLFLVMALSSWRLCILLSGQGLALSLGTSLRLSLIGALFSNFLPGSGCGDLVRIYLATSQHAGRRTEIATTLVIDRAIGLLALLLAPLLIATVAAGTILRNEALEEQVIVAAFGSVALIGGLMLFTNPEGLFRRGVMRVLGRSRLGAYAHLFFESVRGHRRNGRVLLSTLLLSLLIQALVIAAIQLILLANGANSPNLMVALLTPFGMLANALPLTPGGLGVGEAAFDALFLFVGVAGGAEAILSWRVLTTLIDLCGVAILLAGRTQVSIIGPMTEMKVAERSDLPENHVADGDEASRF